jgi:hypothetical protein
LAPAFAAPGAVFDAGATFFFAIFDVVITSFSVFFVHGGFCHLFMFFWYRDIHFVLVPKFKRLKGVFLWSGCGKRVGVFCGFGEAAGFEHCIREVWVCLKNKIMNGRIC